MIKVYQSLFVDRDGDGDCFNACVASIMELPLKDVRDVLPSDPGVWFLNWKRWFLKRDMVLDMVSVLQPPKGYHIGSVFTSRTFPEGHLLVGQYIPHAVVFFDSMMVHNPYPSVIPIPIASVSHYYSITPFIH